VAGAFGQRQAVASATAGGAAEKGVSGAIPLSSALFCTL